jgi:hypothetical protein
VAEDVHREERAGQAGQGCERQKRRFGDAPSAVRGLPLVPAEGSEGDRAREGDERAMSTIGVSGGMLIGIEPYRGRLKRIADQSSSSATSDTPSKPWPAICSCALSRLMSAPLCFFDVPFG